MEELILRKESKPDKSQLMQLMISSQLGIISSPSPRQMLQALTMAAAGDRWDMERIEILGDAFLSHHLPSLQHGP